jgi:hypothetical protein
LSPGIGKHGKFYKLSEVPLKDWELEDSYEEIKVENVEPTKPTDDAKPKDTKEDSCKKFTDGKS